MNDVILGLLGAIWGGVLIAVKYFVAIALIYAVMWLGFDWFMDKNPEYKAAYEALKKHGTALIANSTNSGGAKVDDSKEKISVDRIMKMIKGLEEKNAGEQNAR